MNQKVTVITGRRGAGKSRYCLELLDRSERLGLKCGGIISPAVYNSGVKTAFFTMDVVTKEQRLCGVHTENGGTIGAWKMDPAVLQWGNRLLESSCPCDCLFVDELGPLEFIKHQGYIEAFELLRNGAYGKACVVVRPECIDAFRTIIPDFDVYSIEV